MQQSRDLGTPCCCLSLCQSLSCTFRWQGGLTDPQKVCGLCPANADSVLHSKGVCRVTVLLRVWRHSRGQRGTAAFEVGSNLASVLIPKLDTLAQSHSCHVVAAQQAAIKACLLQLLLRTLRSTACEGWRAGSQRSACAHEALHAAGDSTVQHDYPRVFHLPQTRCCCNLTCTVSW